MTKQKNTQKQPFFAENVFFKKIFFVFSLTKTRVK